MNLLHLRYFYEVARTQSFTESSRSLRVSQPAISKMVRLLEDDLGQRLFERDRRGVRLTENGEILFVHASRIFSEAERARDAIASRGTPAPYEGEWTLGASDNLAIHLIPPVLGRFKEDHPALRIGLFAGTSAQIKTELHYDRCRLGLFFTPLRAGEPFEGRQVHESEFWIVIAVRNRWLKRGKYDLAALKRSRAPRIESRHSDYAAGFPASFQSQKLGLTTPPWLEVNQHEIKRQLVLQGFGFALMIRHTVEDDVRAGRLRRIATDRVLRAPIYAAWRKGRGPGRISESFLERCASAW